MSEYTLGNLVLKIDGNNFTIEVLEPIEPEQLLAAVQGIKRGGIKLASQDEQHRLLRAAGLCMENMPAFNSNDNISPALMKCVIAETLAQQEGLTLYSMNVSAKPYELQTCVQPAKIGYSTNRGDEEWDDEYDEDDDWDDDDEEWDDE